MLTFAPHMVEKDSAVIQSNGFLLALTLEYFKFPSDLCGMVKQKSSLGRLGLSCSNGDAGWVDPGFEGHIVLELVNNGPFAIRLTSGMAIGQLVYMYTTANPIEVKPEVYSGNFQKQQDFNILGWKKALFSNNYMSNLIRQTYIWNDPETIKKLSE